MDQPSTSKQSSGHDDEQPREVENLLSYAQSEYSLSISADAQKLIGNNDDQANEILDEENCTDDEIELGTIKLNDFPEVNVEAEISSSYPFRNFSVRQYVNCDLSRSSNMIVSMCGGAELPAVAPNLTLQELQYEKQSLRAKEQHKYRRFQRLAIVCPSNDCQEIINAANMLAHYLKYHLTIPRHEVYIDQEIYISLDSKLFSRSTSKGNCAAVLLYKNLKYCVRNANLEKKMAQKWLRHIPILLMIQKCSWDSMIPSGHTVSQFYVIWLFCLEAQLSFRITLASASPHGGDQLVKQESGPSNFRQQIISSCMNSQLGRKWDLLKDGPKLMRLSHSEMKELTKDFEGTLKLELIVCDESRSDIAKDVNDNLYNSLFAGEQQAAIHELTEQLARLHISDEDDQREVSNYETEESDDDDNNDDDGIKNVDSVNNVRSEAQKRHSNDVEGSILPLKKIRTMKNVKHVRKFKNQQIPKCDLSQLCKPFIIKWFKEDEITNSNAVPPKRSVFWFGEQNDDIEAENDKSDATDQINDIPQNIESVAEAQNLAKKH